MTIPTLVLALLTTAIGADALIPKKCANNVAFMDRKCCPTPTIEGEANPGPCGVNIDRARGDCSDVVVRNKYDTDDRDIRRNWPFGLFNKSCTCTGNFGGYDCGDCKFGYTGTNCDEKKNRERKSLKVLTDDEWKEYRGTLDAAKNMESTRYMVVTESYREMGTSREMALENALKNITVYDLFIWLHHFAAKDNESKSVMAIQFGLKINHHQKYT